MGIFVEVWQQSKSLFLASSQLAWIGRNPIVYCRISYDLVSCKFTCALCISRRTNSYCEFTRHFFRTIFWILSRARRIYVGLICYTVCPKIFENIFGRRHCRACYLFVTTYVSFPLFLIEFLEITYIFVNLARDISVYLSVCFKFILFFNRLLNNQSRTVSITRTALSEQKIILWQEYR